MTTECNHKWTAINTYPGRADHWCSICGTLRISYHIDDSNCEQEFYVPENKMPNAKNDGLDAPKGKL